MSDDFSEIEEEIEEDIEEDFDENSSYVSKSNIENSSYNMDYDYDFEDASEIENSGIKSAPSTDKNIGVSKAPKGILKIEEQNNDDFENDYADDFEASRYSDKSGRNTPSARMKSQSQLNDSYNGYSRDFDEFSPSKSLLVSQQSLCPQPLSTNDSSLPNSSIQIGNLLSANQADVIVNELGKEVARMRNYQRKILQERRMSALEKKSRAEMRRNAYLKEMDNLKSQQKLAQEELEYKYKEIEHLQASLLASKSHVQMIEHSKTLLQEEYDSLKENWNSIVKECQDLKGSLIQAQCEHEETKNKLKTVDLEKTSEISKYKQLLEIAAKSLEAQERRFLVERDKLPEHHQRILKDQESRLMQFEVFLKEKESRLNLEEAARIAALENRRKEDFQEWKASRLLWEQEIQAQKQTWQEQREELQQEKLEFQRWKSREQEEIEKKTLVWQQQQMQLLKDQEKLQHASIEFETRVSSMSSILATVDEEKKRSLARQKQLDQQELEFQHRQQEIRLLEERVVEREIEFQHIEEDLRTREKELWRNRILVKETNQRNTLLERRLSQDKFQIYQTAMKVREILAQGLTLMPSFSLAIPSSSPIAGKMGSLSPQPSTDGGRGATILSSPHSHLSKSTNHDSTSSHFLLKNLDDVLHTLSISLTNKEIITKPNDSVDQWDDSEPYLPSSTTRTKNSPSTSFPPSPPFVQDKNPLLLNLSPKYRDTMKGDNKFACLRSDCLSSNALNSLSSASSPLGSSCPPFPITPLDYSALELLDDRYRADRFEGVQNSFEKIAKFVSGIK